MKKLLMVLVLLIVVAVGTAFYLGWLNVSTSNSVDKSRSEVTLTIDKEKVKEDLDTVKRKAAEAGEKISQTAKEAREELKEHAHKTIDGQVQAVDLQKKEVTVKGNDGTDAVTVKVDAQTKVKIGDRDGSLADVKKGDTVTLVHTPKDGIDTALSLWIKPAKT